VVAARRVSGQLERGLRRRRVLAEFDPDVAVLQESWSPDGGTPAVHRLAAGWNATGHEAVFGRGRVEPSPI